MHRTITTIGSLALVAGSAYAEDTQFVGGSFLEFSNPTGSDVPSAQVINNATQTGGTSTFENGIPFDPVLNGPSILEFTGVGGISADPEFDVMAGETTPTSDEFLVGNFTYFNDINNTVDDPPFEDSFAEGLDGTLVVEFDLPAGLGTQQFMFDFDFEITPNTDDDGDPIPSPGSDDILNITPQSLAQVFVVDGVEFTISLTRLEVTEGPQAGDSLDELVISLPEEQLVAADVFAVITTEIIPLPGPAGLGLAGLAAIASIRRRR